MTTWAEEELQQEAICGRLKYEISYKTGQEAEQPIEDLIKMSNGIFEIRPTSKVLAGEYEIQI